MRSENFLIHETSPYLLQHRLNPVKWYPYGDEAFKKAKAENKLMIISIGYFACHWCHVMEHESFEDDEVAELMNRYFVSVKIDREERPDLDSYYMDAMHVLNQRGGWPLNCFALPDGRPFWGGTYFRKTDWMRILNQIASIYASDPQLLTEQADVVGNRQNELNRLIGSNTFNQTDETTFLEEAVSIHLRFADNIHGGYAGAPKFPMPASLMFLLRADYRFHSKRNMDFNVLTLNCMARGGIFDQLGGGFARYSTDEYWKVPHFEKMLYDNAQLLSLYSEAYRFYNNPLFREIAIKTIEFVKRELYSPHGLFYASLDADSEGSEGTYYIWQQAEIDDVLKEQTEIFSDYYAIGDKGLWEDGKNILLHNDDDSAFCVKWNLVPEQLDEVLTTSRYKLLKFRDGRLKPALDYKIIAGWNALMITGLVDAYKAFGDENFLQMALDSANQMISQFIDDSGRMIHSRALNQAGCEAFLDDYALTALAMISLTEATLDKSWVEVAGKLLRYAIHNFLDSESGLYFYTSVNQRDVHMRKIDYSDNVIPSSNSVLCLAFIRYSRIIADERFLKFAGRMIEVIKPEIQKQPLAFSAWLTAVYEYEQNYYTIFLSGPDAKGMSRDFYKYFCPNAIVTIANPLEGITIKSAIIAENETVAYICGSGTCFPPVHDTNEILKIVRS